MKRYFKELSLLLVYFPYRGLIQILPFQISYQIATLLGNIQYFLLSPYRKRQAKVNMDLFFGDKLNTQQKKSILRRFYINKQKEFVDLFILGRKDYKRYLKTCSVEGLDYVDQVLSRGKGMLGVNFHFGSVNLSSPYAIYRGYKIVGFLVLPAFIKGVRPWISQRIIDIKYTIWRERGNFQIFTSLKSLGSMVVTQYQYLRENYIVSAAGDGALGQKFILVDFFNVKLKAPLGPALLAAKAGTDMVPCFIIRQKDNAHHLIFKEPIPVKNEDEETLKLAVQKYIKYLEYYISKYPDHWTYWIRIEREGFENGVPVIQLAYYRLLEAEI